MKICFIIDSFILDCQCPTIKLTLSSNASLLAQDIQGSYELSKTVNGKQSWVSISGSSAIWYDITFKKWRVGALSKLGTSTNDGISSINTDYDCPQQIANDKWKYFESSNLMTNIHCGNTSKNIDLKI